MAMRRTRTASSSTRRPTVPMPPVHELIPGSASADEWTGSRNPLHPSEASAYLASVLLLQLAYVFVAVTYPNDNIGIHQLRHLGLPGAILLLGIVWVISLGVSGLHSRISWTPPPGIRSPSSIALALVVACSFGWMFL